MGLGAVVDAVDFKPWLRDAKVGGLIEPYYWDQYRRLLAQNGLPPGVVQATDQVTDRILDRLGNPRDMSRWSRWGMVVGHVQSGKTANYTGPAGRSTEVRCNAVAPGWIDTDLSESFVDPMPDPVAFRHDSDRIHPVGRTGNPEEVAALMARLTSDGAAFVTGQVWTVGGGRMAKLSLPH